MIASSAPDGDPVMESAVAALARHTGPSGLSTNATEFQFDHVRAKPLSRETWLTYATPYRDHNVDRHWILVTAMPEAFYLAGLRVANSRSAMVFALALLLSLVLAAALASIVTAPLRRMARATQAMARGDMSIRVPGSKLEELGSLTDSFNDMAAKLKMSFDDLVGEVETRKRRERELQKAKPACARAKRAGARCSRVRRSVSFSPTKITDCWTPTGPCRRCSATPREELKELSTVDLMAEEERGRRRRRFAELREGKRPNYEVVAPLPAEGRLADLGQHVCLDHSRRREHHADLLATAIDITDRHKAESELRRYATYLAEAEKLSHTGCWAQEHQDRRIVLVAGGMAHFWPRPGNRRNCPIRSFSNWFIRKTAPLSKEFSLARCGNKQAYDILFRAVMRDGTIKYLHSVGKPQFEESGEVVEYIGVTMDETDRVRANAAVQEAQAELARVARLTTMGELAASIAHEINQPLAAVVANGNAALRWLARALPIWKKPRAALKAIVNGGQSRRAK